MQSICGFIFSLLLIAATCNAQDQSQQPENDTTQVEKPKAPKKPKDFRPTGVRFGTDLISLIKSSTQSNFTGWELNGDIDFANYFFVADFGSWGRDHVLPNGEYHNQGTYYRFGIDVNLLGKDPDHNMFFVGARYAHAVFSESLTYQETVSLFGTMTHTLENPSVNGGWGELVTGLRVKLFSGLWMGYTARMKFAPGAKGNSVNFSSYDMPGYGPIQQTPWWGFNYQVFWRIPIRKEKAAAKS